MSIFTRIIDAIRGKGLYDLHPELQWRLPILRAFSDADPTALRDDFHSNAEIFSTHIWVYKAIKVLKDNIAPLYLRVVQGSGQDLDPLDEHPFSQLLQSPNPSMSSADFWEEWVVDQMLSGEWGIEAVRNNGAELMEFWPRQSWMVYIRKNKNKKLYREVVEYKIDNNDDEPYILKPDEFIHYKFYNPQNVWRGLAPIAAVRMGINIDQLSQAWSRLFFKNQARPDYALIAPEGLTKTEREEYEEYLSNFRGGEGLHMPIILEKGITDVKPLNWAPKDLEWLEQRKLARDEIGAIFGVPDEIMGYGRNTYENFDTADRVLWTLTITPMVRFRDRVITAWAKRYNHIDAGQRVETDLTAIPQLQEDKSEKIEQLEKLANKGYPVNVINQWLGLGLPEIMGGDIGYLPLNMVPVMGNPPDTNGRSMQQSFKIAETTDQKDWHYGMGAPLFDSDEHKALLKRRNALTDPFVSRMQRELKKFWQRQQNEVTRGLRDNRAFGRGKWIDKIPVMKLDEEGRIPPVSELFNLTNEVQAFISAFLSLVAGAVDAAGSAEVEALGLEIAFGIERPEVISAYRGILQHTAQKTQNRVWLDLVGIFEEAELEGESVPQIMERLSAYYGGLKTDWQTERIARTTITAASNLGATEAWAQSEVVRAREWISALIPGRTRDEHATAHGQQRGLRESFDVGGELLQYPGDPQGSPGNIINCLCTLGPVVME